MNSRERIVLTALISLCVVPAAAVIWTLPGFMGVMTEPGTHKLIGDVEIVEFGFWD